jgi:hypothetical protein
MAWHMVRTAFVFMLQAGLIPTQHVLSIVDNRLFGFLFLHGCVEPWGGI